MKIFGRASQSIRNIGAFLSKKLATFLIRPLHHLQMKERSSIGCHLVTGKESFSGLKCLKTGSLLNFAPRQMHWRKRLAHSGLLTMNSQGFHLTKLSHHWSRI